MNLQDYKGVMTFAEQVEGKLTNVSLELLGKGQELAKDLNTNVTAVLIGENMAELAQKLVEYGADRVIVADDPELKYYRTEPYTQVLANVINEYKPEAMLVGATAIGRDLGPRLAGRIHTGLTADCTKLEIDPENKELRMTRPAFGGNLMATILCSNFRPQMPPSVRALWLSSCATRLVREKSFLTASRLKRTSALSRSKMSSKKLKKKWTFRTPRSWFPAVVV